MHFHSVFSCLFLWIKQICVTVTPGLHYSQFFYRSKPTVSHVCLFYFCTRDVCSLFHVFGSQRERCSSFDYCFATFMEVQKAMSSQWEISSSVISPVGELCCLQAPHSLAVLPCFYSSPTRSLYTQNCSESLHGVKHTVQP